MIGPGPDRTPDAEREIEVGIFDLVAAFRDVLEKHRFKHVTTRGVLEAVNRATGEDYTEWFNRFVTGIEWPKQGKKSE